MIRFGRKRLTKEQQRLVLAIVGDMDVEAYEAMRSRGHPRLPLWHEGGRELIVDLYKALRT